MSLPAPTVVQDFEQPAVIRLPRFSADEKLALLAQQALLEQQAVAVGISGEEGLKGEGEASRQRRTTGQSELLIPAARNVADVDAQQAAGAAKDYLIRPNVLIVSYERPLRLSLTQANDCALWAGEQQAVRQSHSEAGELSAPEQSGLAAAGGMPENLLTVETSAASHQDGELAEDTVSPALSAESLHPSPVDAETAGGSPASPEQASPLAARGTAEDHMMAQTTAASPRYVGLPEELVSPALSAASLHSSPGDGGTAGGSSALPEQARPLADGDEGEDQFLVQPTPASPQYVELADDTFSPTLSAESLQLSPEDAVAADAVAPTAPWQRETESDAVSLQQDNEQDSQNFSEHENTAFEDDLSNVDTDSAAGYQTIPQHLDESR